MEVTPDRLLRLRNKRTTPERMPDAAAPQYARQALEIQELGQKKPSPRSPREGSQSE